MRLIDADAMKSKLVGSRFHYIRNFLNKQPTIEAEPVRHGRWVKRPNTKGQVYCSECGTLEEITDNNFKSKRCPNCGAKMQGGSDE